ncbi:MAG: YncE family protein, partial [Myxococcota bacterium]
VGSLAAIGLVALLAGCSADSGLSYDRSDGAGDYAPPADTGGDSDGDGEPPETEDDFLRLAPAATDAYVFIANPARDTVTRVSVPSLAALTTEVGAQPSVVATAPDYRHAVTLNEGSDDISLIIASTMAVANVEVRPNLNRLALSDDGLWAMAWYDADVESEDPPDGVLSFNEVSLVHLPTGTHTPMAVGFNPHGVEWSADGRLAVVVSDASLALVDLTAETLAPTLVPIADDPVDAPPAEEIVLSPDGAYAYVRQFGASDLLVVDLVDHLVDRVPVGANPTDMDLSPDGTRLAVVARGAREVWTFAAEDPWATPEVLSFPSPYGSLLFAGDGTALLYTNATALTTYGVWEVGSTDIVERSLVKPVASVGVSPTGGSALVFHTKADADGADPESPFYGAWALTLIDLDDFRTNPLVLDAEPTSFATSDDGRWGFFVMDGLRYLEILDFESLLYDEVALPSAPVHLGVLPGGTTAWVSQEHDLGRISFYEPGSASLDTITGFELNAGIEHE